MKGQLIQNLRVSEEAFDVTPMGNCACYRFLAVVAAASFAVAVIVKLGILPLATQAWAVVGLEPWQGYWLRFLRLA